MGGLSIALSALCLGLLWGLLRQRQKTKKLYRQMEAFLDGQKAPLEISLGESPSARLQNAAARLETPCSTPGSRPGWRPAAAKTC